MSSAEKVEAMFCAASYHEAGHAVLAMHYGVEVLEVRIHVSSSWANGAQPDGETECGLEEDDPESIAEGIVISHAGPEAEAWWWQDHHQVSIGRARRMHPAHGAGDRRMIAESLAQLHPTWGLALRLEREAQALVSEVWGSIVAVAEGLREANGYLTGSEVVSLA